MKKLLNERRAHTFQSLREYAIVVLRFLGVERTDENILMMVDKLIDILIETKSTDVVLNPKGGVHNRFKNNDISESDIKRIIKKVINS